MTIAILSRQEKRAILGWCLFDFANSIPAVIGGIYFSKWFVDGIGGGSILYNSLLFLSIFLMIIIGRWVGIYIDKNGVDKWLRLTTFLISISLLALFSIAYSDLSSNIKIIAAFIFFCIFICAYQIGRICHNVYLRRYFSKDVISRMSGLGTVANWIGSIFGIVVTIPIITNLSLENGRVWSFACAFLLYVPLSLIAVTAMISGIKHYKENNLEDKAESLPNISKNIISILKSLGMTFLIYLLLFNVMQTVEKNLPTYLTNVYGMGEVTQSIAFLTILVTAAVGGGIATIFVKTNNSRTWLISGTTLLTLGIISVIINNHITLWMGFIIAGISYGILESAMRLDFINKFSVEESGEYFGMYSIIERSAGLVGPMMWILPFLIMDKGSSQYSLAMTIMACVGIVSLILLLRVQRLSAKE